MGKFGRAQDDLMVTIKRIRDEKHIQPRHRKVKNKHGKNQIKYVHVKGLGFSNRSVFRSNSKHVKEYKK